MATLSPPGHSQQEQMLLAQVLWAFNRKDLKRLQSMPSKHGNDSPGLFFLTRVFDKQFLYILSKRNRELQLSGSKKDIPGWLRPALSPCAGAASPLALVERSPG